MATEKVDKRELIMNAAQVLIAENGFHGSPTAMIARKAGVGIGSIYRYFQSKDELICEVFKDIVEKWDSMITEMDLTRFPIREQFIRTYKAMYRYVMANPVEYKFLMQFYNSPYGIAHRREKLESQEKEISKDLYDTGKTQQVIKDLPDEMLCGLVFGPLEFIFRSHEAGFIELDEVVIEKMVESCWDAIKR